MNLDKSKILNIILIVLALVVLGICLFFILTTKGYEGSEVTLLKDMDSEEIRLIKDKTDVYNNAEGTIVMKGEKPIDYIEPDDLFKKEETKDNTPPVNNSQVSIYVGNPNKGELKEYNPEIDYEVIQEEVVVIPERIKRISLDDALFVLKQIRNEGLKASNWGSLLYNIDGSTHSIYSAAGENGAILVPFSINNTKQLENLKKWSDFHSQYGEFISIVFLNTSTYIRESEAKILTYFEENGISKDIPVYYDEFHEISNTIKIDNINNLGYCIVNRDGYIYEKGSLTSELKFDMILNDLNTVMDEYKEQETLIVDKYNQGYIMVYDDVQRALDGTLDAYYLEHYANSETETEATEIETE